MWLATPVVSSVLAEIRSAFVEIFRMYPEVLEVTTKSVLAHAVDHARAVLLDVAFAIVVDCPLVITTILALVLMVLNPVS
jgi:hypothetical protein